MKIPSMYPLLFFAYVCACAHWLILARDYRDICLRVRIKRITSRIICDHDRFYAHRLLFAWSNCIRCIRMRGTPGYQGYIAVWWELYRVAHRTRKITFSKYLSQWLYNFNFSDQISWSNFLEIEKVKNLMELNNILRAFQRFYHDRIKCILPYYLPQLTKLISRYCPNRGEIRFPDGSKICKEVWITRGQGNFTSWKKPVDCESWCLLPESFEHVFKTRWNPYICIQFAVAYFVHEVDVFEKTKKRFGGYLFSSSLIFFLNIPCSILPRTCNRALEISFCYSITRNIIIFQILSETPYRPDY